MEIYRITLEKWAGKLVASGNSARWNSKRIEMLYFASTRSLACLENVVHRNPIELSLKFKVTVVEIPTDLVQDLNINTLPNNWYLTDISAYNLCRTLGDNWILSKSTLALKVPSAIIKNEYNFLLNPNHPDFVKVKTVDTEPFYFDPRIKII